MDRRKFIKYQLQGALWLAAGTGLYFTPDGFSEAVPDIAEVIGSRKAATRAAVDLLGGMKKFVKPGNRVLIKPNMSFPSSPEMGTNTHPEVVYELAAMCKEAGAGKILILDNTLGPPEACLQQSGIRDICRSIDENMVYAINEDEYYKKISIQKAVTKSTMEIAKEALKSDVLIAVPVAKSHSATGVSLSMKGMMGLINDRSSMHWQGLSSGIVDICTILKADLTVIDGSRVLTTNGPRGPGKVVIKNTIIASRDMVAADAHAISIFEWYGKKFEPRQVAHILEAHKRGFGRMDVENLSIKKVVL
ncbi:DUF362 domain-containing protein [bacterium]|nr:DUF362 domain-containing protein [bacterium]